MLCRALPCQPNCHECAPICHGHEPTSRPVTGFSSRVKCVNLTNPCKASRSANSAIEFCVNTSVVKFGTVLPRLLCKLAILFRASRSVCSRGDNGKLPNTEISLSVRSRDSKSCAEPRFSIAGMRWPRRSSSRSDRGRCSLRRCLLGLLLGALWLVGGPTPRCLPGALPASVEQSSDQSEALVIRCRRLDLAQCERCSFRGRDGQCTD